MGKKKFNDHPFPYHAEIELEITTLTNLGLGLGRVPLPEKCHSLSDTLSALPTSAPAKCHLMSDKPAGGDATT
ncbi:MAG: hypothetical protein ABII82_08445, partial [Verrucomicrobiota bacterium]